MSIALSAKVETLEKQIAELKQALYQQELRLDAQATMIERLQDRNQKNAHKHG